MTLVHQCAIDVYTSFGCFLHVFLVAYDTPPFIDRVGGGGGEAAGRSVFSSLKSFALGL